MKLTAHRFPRWTRRVLGEHGFHRDNTQAVAITCRDEICGPLLQRLDRTWGHAFNGQSLAGMPTLGQTGLGAALAHAPTVDGRRRLVVVHLVHIGDDPSPGITDREGMQVPTCGALSKLLAELGGSSGKIQIGDPEQSLLHLQVTRALEGKPRPTRLVALTEQVRVLGLGELKEQLAEAFSPADVDYGLFSGTLVHGLEGDEVVVATAQARVAGRTIALL